MTVPSLSGQESQIPADLGRRIFSLRNARLSDEEVELLYERMADEMSRSPRLLEVVRISTGKDLNSACGDYKRLARDFFEHLTRASVETVTTEVQAADTVTTLENIMAYVAEKCPTLDGGFLIAQTRIMGASVRRHALGQLAKKTLGMETMISKLRAQAEALEPLAPERAANIRAVVDQLSCEFPRDFRPAAPRQGRPRLNPWKRRQLEELFRDGMATKRIAALLAMDEAYVRRRRKAWRLCLPNANSSADTRATAQARIPRKGLKKRSAQR